MLAYIRRIRIHCIARTTGYSLVEILVTVMLIACMGTILIQKISSTSVNVSNTKLTSDVKKLNEIVSVYLASGGSLAGVTTAQGVLDKLKTVLSAADMQRQVGVMTGRGVDIRQVAKTQTTAQASTHNLRAFWNATTNQFTLASTGTGGVGSFDVDDSLTSVPVKTESRTQTNELYNGGAGWVWAPGTNAAAALAAPISIAMANTGVTPLLDPTIPAATSTSTSSSSTSSSTGSSSSSSSSSSSTGSTSGTPPSGSLPNGSTPGVLPTPIITTKGGRFTEATYPSVVYIDPNGSPAGVSILEYQFNGTGAWIPYTGGIVVPSGTTVVAKNVSTNTALYGNSPTDTESYYQIQSWFAGTVAAKWNASTGPSGLKSTRNNSNPLNVSEADGTAASSSSNGQNTFTFTTPGSFPNTAPNTTFQIGSLVYHNGTINSGTGSTGLNLQLDITMSTPAIALTSAHIAIALNNTSNTSCGNNSQSADAATLSNPVTDYSVVVAGVTYTLNVAYGTIDSSQGYVSGNTCNVWEGATGTVTIIASFVSNH